MAFPHGFLDEIRARVSLMGLVSRRVQLKQRGRGDWWGISPFTNEKTPSFHVVEDKGFFHCFATGEHGDHFTWLMKTEGLSFPEAVEHLAGEAGLEMPQSTPEERHREERRKSLVDVTEAAAAWYSKQLYGSAGRPALEYLTAERGLKANTVEAFGLGYAPDDRNALSDAMKAEGIEMPALIEAGLYRQPEDGRAPYPLFRDRIMFPITDKKGRAIAFGGRFMGDAKAAGVGKYINSPETPLFDKSRTLYNLKNAADGVRHGDDPLIVVEGYMDVISLWEFGYIAAVAPLGTAITETQIAILWRVAEEPVLCFDGDVAGQMAAIRAARRALPDLKPGKSLRFAFLEDGDPDDVVRNQGTTVLRRVVSEAQPLSAFLFLTETDDARLETPERRARARADLMALADTIRDDGVRREYGRDFSDRFWKLQRAEADRRFKAARRQARREVGAWDKVSAAHAREALGRASHETFLKRLPRRQQQIALATLINHPGLIERFEEALDLVVFDGDLDKIRRGLQNLAVSGESLDAERVRSHFEGSGDEALLRVVTADPQVYLFARQARADAPEPDAAKLVEHILLLRQQERLEGEMRSGRRQSDGGDGAGDLGERTERRLASLHGSLVEGEARLADGLSLDDDDLL